MSKTDILNQTSEEIRIAAAQLQIAGFLQAADTMLADFLAMSVEARRGRWSQLDSNARQQLAWAVVRKCQNLTWAAAPDFGLIAAQIEALDARFGFTSSEAATLGALEGARDRAVTAEWSAVQRGDTEETKFFARERAATERALRMFLSGIRAEQLDTGAWLVRSEESDLVYSVSREGACSCPAGRNERLCKHVALVSAVETGIDNLTTFDDYEPEPEYLAAARSMGSRLAAARRPQFLLEVA